VNRHVSESDLALASGGDLPRWRAYLVRRHVGRCASCAGVAATYGQAGARLRELAEGGLVAPAWLAERIMARTRAGQAPSAAEAFLPLRPWALALRAGALCALVALAILMIAWPAPAPSNLTATEALATRDTLIGVARNAHGRERLEMYTGGRGGLAEVSATGSGVGVMETDPATGAVRITRVIMEE